MLEILAATDEKVTQICNDNSFVKNENTKVMVATEKGNELGFCIFDIVGGAVYIKMISPESDVLLADGLLRSSLFFATTKNCTDAYYSSTMNENLLEKIGFVENKETKELKLLKIFDSCSGCHE